MKVKFQESEVTFWRKVLEVSHLVSLPTLPTSTHFWVQLFRQDDCTGEVLDRQK